MKSTLVCTVLITLSLSIQFLGTNLAGGEFGTSGDPSVPVPNPGTYGSNYIYPSVSGSATYFSSIGMNIFRIPFRWERMQTSLSNGLDSSELSRYKTLVNGITSTLGSYVIIDPHNYGRYNGNIIGESSSVAVSDFSKFWGLLATEFKSNSKVIFNLMNEPNRLDTATWASTCNSAIEAIRATGATNLILVPGNRWTGGHSWYATDSYGISNAEAMATIHDSISNYAFDVHQYLDSDYSGTSTACVSATIGSGSLSSVTQWARNNGKKLFLGEFGASSFATCLLAIDNLLDYLDLNGDVWLGGTWWAAGPWWGDYFMSIESTSSAADKLQTSILISICPRDPLQLQRQQMLLFPMRLQKLLQKLQHRP